MTTDLRDSLAPNIGRRTKNNTAHLDRLASAAWAQDERDWDVWEWARQWPAEEIWTARLTEVNDHAAPSEAT